MLVAKLAIRQLDAIPDGNNFLGYQSSGVLPIWPGFPSDAPTNHTERRSVFHALSRDWQIGTVDQVAVLIAEHLVAATFLNVVLNERVAFRSRALAIRDDCVAAGILITKLRDVSSEVLMGLSIRHGLGPQSRIEVPFPADWSACGYQNAHALTAPNGQLQGLTFRKVDSVAQARHCQVVPVALMQDDIARASDVIDM
jgi:hypothetical protein